MVLLVKKTLPFYIAVANVIWVLTRPKGQETHSASLVGLETRLFKVVQSLLSEVSWPKGQVSVGVIRGRVIVKF